MADLRAARSLKTLGECVFSQCEKLKRVLLNEGLESISKKCFNCSGLEEIDIPGNIRYIDQ